MHDPVAKTDRVYLCGHRGMVGSALVRALKADGYNNLLMRTSADLDLRDQAKVTELFANESIDHVIIAAARVGGIHANSTYPADFLYDNLMISANVIEAAFRSGVKRLIYLGSTCIYPRLAAQPMHESCLLTSKLETTNEAYAIAKIAGIKLCEAYNRQHGCDFRALMPTNLYGLYDNFHPENSHVLPALMRRFHEAKIADSDQVIVWGTGTPRRELLYVDDLAEAVLFVLNLAKQSYLDVTGDDGLHINVGTGKEIRIADLAKLVARVVGYQGEIVFDADKPDGTPRKVTDVEKMQRLGWHAATALEDGLNRVYEWFQQRYEQGDFRGRQDS